MPLKKEKLHLIFKGDPPAFECPECACDKYQSYLKYVRKNTTQWDSVVTTYFYYRCQLCWEKFVSTNGREPQIAAPY
jgi:hypothetical protein